MTLAIYPLKPAKLAFNDRGLPVSAEYGDVYHAQAGALAQADYVFLRGNGLPERWRGRKAFTVCESGFGQGATFLACWQAWRLDPQRSERLHFISFEAHPFRLADLAQLHARLPEDVQDIAAELRAQWPVLTPGIHRLDLAQGRLSLTLVLGPIEHYVREVQACVDAFFLDGFAPRLNPDMWSRTIFSQFVRLAAPGATAATWCSASQVRKNLEAAGFQVERVPGFGMKREMSVARLRPHLGRNKDVLTPNAHTVIIGGGLAGATMAYALSLRGHAVQVFDPEFTHGAETTHHGHALAALSPVFAMDDAPIARLSRAGLLRARSRWRSFSDDARPYECGTLVLSPDSGDALRTKQALERLEFPSEWVSWRQQEEHGSWATLPVAQGLYFPMGMLIRPVALLRALYASSLISMNTARVASIVPSVCGGYRLMDAQGRCLTVAQHVVVATAGAIPHMVQGLLNLADAPRLQAIRHLAGQVSYAQREQGVSDYPHIVSGNGYVLPAGEQFQVLGSTYQEEGKAVCSIAGHRENQAKARSMFQHTSRLWLQADQFGGWAGWRAAMCDHLPVAGDIPGHPNVWLAGAYGSRGLSWSMLLADYYAARQFGEPSPLERRLEKALLPR